MGKIRVETLYENIPYVEITKLVNNAFAEYKEQNLAYAGVNQGVEITKNRLKDSRCIVAWDGDILVGTMGYRIVEKNNRKWYEDKRFATFYQVAVEPSYRDCPVYLKMCFHLYREIMEEPEKVESCICDTSIKAEELVKAYVKNGMQIVDVISWPNTNYYSYVFRKSLNGNEFSKEFCEKKVKRAKIKCMLCYPEKGGKRLWYRIWLKLKRMWSNIKN